MVKSRETTYRNWSVVKNNYTDDDIKTFMAFAKGKNQICYGLEIGEGGTPHIQGAMIIANKISASALIKKLKGFHVEIKFKKSSCKQLFAYCLKGTDDSKPVKEWTYDNTGPNYNGDHYGDFPTNQGERSDIDDMKECNTMKEAFETGHNLQCIQYFEKYLKYYEDGRKLKPVSYWYFGSTGCSKSWLAKKMAKSWGNIYHKTDKSKWWDGYDGEQIIIIDDYNPNTWDINFNDLLHLCGEGEVRVETKGGSRQFKGLRIWITSPRCVADTFMNKDIGGNIDQLEDRVHQFAFSKKYGHKQTELGNMVW